MKKLYEKPLFRRATGIAFVLKYVKIAGRVCRQCCSCHGCR